MRKVIPELLREAAEKSKDTPAVNYFHEGWVTITYGELLNNTKSIASHLMQSGIGKGDRVAILSENRHEWCTAYLSASLAGAVAVPIDAQLGPEEIHTLLADSESKAVFHSLKTKDNLFGALNILPAPFSPVTINFDDARFIDICKTPPLEGYPGIAGEDVASLIYTSGTTGKPKGVLLTHENFISDADAIGQIGIIEPGDNFIAILPYHHTYPFMGNFILPLSLGLTVTFPPSLKGPDLLATIREKGVTILVGVPQLLELIRNGILNRIRQLPGPLPGIMLRVLKLCGEIKKTAGTNAGKVIFKSAHRALGSQFRFFASGGARLNPEVMQDLEALGFTVLEGYGLTETAPVVTFNSPRLRRKPGSIGKQLPSVEIKIISPETGEEAGAHEEGEIVIKGPMVMKGYYKNPEATAQVLKEGWFASGDLGYKDKEGYIFVTGRLKEVIVLSSGKNIYPEEVEKQYQKVPLIKEICVMGIGEKGLVESLHAAIVPDFEYAKKAQIGNLQETLKWEIHNVSLRLPQYMRIRGYTVQTDPLPRTPLGKLRRFMVKDMTSARGKATKVKEEDKKLMQDAVGSKVVECLTPLLKEKVRIQSSDNLELDLGLDSLARIELIVTLEKAFSLKIPETLIAEVQTVEELVRKIKEFGTGGLRDIQEKPLWRDILRTEPDIEEQKKAGLEHSFLDWMITRAGLALIRFLAKAGFRLTGKGLENVPEKGPYIIAPNHASFLDAFCIGSVLPARAFRDLYSLGIQKYFTGNAGRVFARLAHVIPVDQELYLNKALQMSSYVLGKGKSLLIFPEGGRSFDGGLLEFKKGVGILAIELNVPVVPAYIKGSFEALPRNAVWPRFTKIEVMFGRPFHASSLDMTKKPEQLDAYQFFVNEVRKRVEELQYLK